jgi:hypothetical protein
MGVTEQLVPLGAAFFAGIALMAMLGIVMGAFGGVPPHPMDIAGLGFGSVIALGLWVTAIRRQS